MLNQKSDGYNPMRWNCEKDGCFNKKCRPKIEIFAECFPGRINFGDVDAIVEINGKGLILEWKCYSTNIPMGQKIMYERLTKSGLISVLAVHGSAETMDVKEFCWFKEGKQSHWWPATINSIKKEIMNWVELTKSI